MYNGRKKATTDGGKGTLKQTVDQIEPRLSTAEVIAKETTDAAASMLIVIVGGRWHNVFCGIGHRTR